MRASITQRLRWHLSQEPDWELFSALNVVRNRIPYAYWLFYDVVIAILLGWGFLQLSHLFAVGFVFLGLAIFFDIVESVVKWRWQHGEFRQTK